jgi:hypothetical protein
VFDFDLIVLIEPNFRDFEGLIDAEFGVGAMGDVDF